MTKFSYTAISKESKSLSGTVEASSREAAIASLERLGVKPLVVNEVGSRSLVSFLKRGGKVKKREIVVFTRQLSVLVSAGVPLTRSLATLQEQAESKSFKAIIGGIGKEVEGGYTLADSFQKYPDVFNDVFVNMVRAGEAGGILDQILKRLAAQVEQDASMRKKVKSAMTYPMVILSITVIAFFGIMIFVMPRLGKILKDLGGEDAELPSYTQAMLAISDFMRHNAVFIIIGLAVAIWGLRRYIKTPSGKYKFHSLLLRTPVLKTIITKVAVARFARTFASLMGAGVSVLEALSVTGGAIGNKVIEAELVEAAKEVRNGKQLSEPLSKSSHFPPIVSQMIAVGEETGQIDQILVKVADFYEEEVSTTIDGLSSIIEPLMIVVLGSIVGMIAASVMGPISSLSKNIGN